MTRRSSRRAAERATDREVGVVAAVQVAGSEKAAAHRLGLSHSTVKHHRAEASTTACMKELRDLPVELNGLEDAEVHGAPSGDA